MIFPLILKKIDFILLSANSGDGVRVGVGLEGIQLWWQYALVGVGRVGIYHDDKRRVAIVR